LRMFAVAATARGHGIGRRLVEACLDRAPQGTLRRLWLSTSPWMTDAQRLYDALGFERAPCHDHTEHSSGQTFELLAYVRDT
jgi:ribosomal protein S18 acetylase RimI-like enzyme